MNQVELHPYLPQDQLVAFCKENDLLVTAYSPLGSPDSRAEKHAQDPKLLEDALVLALAKKYNASIGQILIAWSIARGIAVIPKSVNQARIVENFGAAEINLDEADMAQLNAIGTSHRFVDGTFFTGPKSPYRLTDLWDS
jgi:alcohol dehydrogenase (NADP+)